MAKAPTADTRPAETADPPQGAAAMVQLQRQAVRGSVLALTNQAIKLVSNVATTLIVALYLGPDEFGLFAVAFSIQALTIIVRDGGLANALIQRKAITDTHLNSVLWAGLALSALAAIVLALIARPLAAAYGQPRLAPILWLVALPIVVQGFGSVQEALLRKRLCFGRLLLADSGSALLASLAAIVAVLLGAGVWGLVLRMVLAPVLLAIFCWLSSAWRPRWELSLAALRSLWAFGGYFFITALLGYGLTRLDSLIIGKLIGVAAAGMFFMARTVALATLQDLIAAVGRVMFPVFSAVQDDPDTLRSGFLTGTRCLATLFFPVVAALIVLSPEAVAVILPERWRDTVPLMQIIALHGLLRCVSNPASQLLYARGRSRLQFLYASVAGLLVIVSFVVGARWGVVGVAVGWTIVAFTLRPVILWFAAREINMSIWDMAINLVPPFLAAAGAAGATRLAIWLWMASGLPMGYGLLGMAVAVGGASYAGLSALLLRDTLAKLWRDLVAARLLQRGSETMPRDYGQEG